MCATTHWFLITGMVIYGCLNWYGWSGFYLRMVWFLKKASLRTAQSSWCLCVWRWSETVSWRDREEEDSRLWRQVTADGTSGEATAAKSAGSICATVTPLARFPHSLKSQPANQLILLGRGNTVSNQMTIFQHNALISWNGVWLVQIKTIVFFIINSVLLTDTFGKKMLRREANFINLINCLVHY